MFWKQFSKKKPKKDGWYQCTVEVPGFQRYVMDLYWYGEYEKWKDNRRQDVFNTYDVYAIDPTTNQFTKNIHSERLCDRTDSVVAWRKIPKPYMRGFVEESWE